MCRSLVRLVPLFALLSACADLDYGSDRQENVFGLDNREGITSSEHPWSAIGRLSNGCTATLVANNIAVTAAHCVLANGDAGGGLSSGTMYFYPNYKNGSYDDYAIVDWFWWGTGYPGALRSSDWAILRLDRNIGDDYGWVGARPYFFAAGDFVSVAGYSDNWSFGQTASIHRDCQVQRVENGLLLYDCDTGRGSSGGPVFGWFVDHYELIGVNVAEYREGGEVTLNLPYYSDNYASIGIPLSPFFADLVDKINTY